MSKTCKNCGATLDDASTFCFQCKHNPDQAPTEETSADRPPKKKKKTVLIIAVIAALAAGILFYFVCCSNPRGVEYYSVKQLLEAKDGRLRDIRTKFNLDKHRPNDYVCVLTGKASGDIKIPRVYKGQVVLYLYGEEPCENLTSLDVSETDIKYITNVCNFETDNTTLKSCSLNGAEFIKNSFNHCASLESADFSELPVYIEYSFSDNASLSKVTFGKDRGKGLESAEGSFRNCVALNGTYVGKRDAYGYVTKGIEEALQKLADQGVIGTDESGDPQLFTEKSAHIRFLDREAGEKLTQEPKEPFHDALVSIFDDSDTDSYFRTNGEVTIDTCKYLVGYESYTSRVDKEYYSNGYDRIAKTTVVFVVDAETGDMVYIHEVGVNTPPDIVQVWDYEDAAVGKELPDQAESYIKEIVAAP